MCSTCEHELLVGQEHGRTGRNGSRILDAVFQRGWTPIGNGGNLIVMYCFAALLLVFFGSGLWSLDTILRRKS
jgi:hypothetical protein